MSYSKHIYIAGPFSAPTPWQVEQNVREAEQVALWVAKLGAVPVCPHTMYRHYEGELPYEAWIEITASLLKRCDAILMLPRWRQSSGARSEMGLAYDLGIKWFFLNDLGDADDTPRAAEMITKWLGGAP